MKLAQQLFGGALVLIGIIWILQGINILPGSFMTGQTKWAVYGALAVAVGVVLIALARKGAGR